MQAKSVAGEMKDKVKELFTAHSKETSSGTAAPAAQNQSVQDTDPAAPPHFKEQGGTDENSLLEKLKNRVAVVDDAITETAKDSAKAVHDTMKSGFTGRSKSPPEAGEAFDRAGVRDTAAGRSERTPKNVSAGASPVGGRTHAGASDQGKAPSGAGAGRVSDVAMAPSSDRPAVGERRALGLFDGW